jgi:hypothetical protein
MIRELLDKLDHWLCSPPHTFDSVLRQLIVRFEIEYPSLPVEANDQQAAIEQPSPPPPIEEKFAHD